MENLLHLSAQLRRLIKLDTLTISSVLNVELPYAQTAKQIVDSYPEWELVSLDKSCGLTEEL